MSVISAVLAFGLAAGSAGLAAGPTTELKWEPELSGASDAVLYRIDGDHPDLLWTVGIGIAGEGLDLKFSPLALRRVGGVWEPTEQPLKSGRLDDVEVRGPSDVWAVGSAPDALESQPLIQHWNGESWEVVPGPELGPGQVGSLDSISEAPNGDFWITGSAGTADLPERVIYRYARGVWHSMPTAGLPDRTYQWELTPLSDTDVWSASIGGIAHFDGTTWTPAKLPGDTGPRQLNVQELVVRGPNDIWAVGHRPDDDLWRRPLVLHYDGDEWTELASPAETAQMHSIQFLDDGALVLGENPQSGQPYVLAQKGESFVRIADPTGAGNLYDSVLSDGKVWTVGAAASDGGDIVDPYVGMGKVPLTNLPG